MKFSGSIIVLLAAPAAALQGGYLSHMGGGSTVKPSSIKPSGPGPAVGASYLDNVGGFSAPVSEPPAPVESAAPITPAATAGSGPAGYLSQMGGGSTMKPSSLKKSGPGPTVGSSYLDNVGGFAAPAAEPVAPATPAAPASAGSGPAGYLSQMGGGSAMKPSSLKKSGPGPTAGSSYLDNVGGFAAPVGGFAAPVAEPAAPAAPAAPASAGSGPAGYLSQMGGGSAMKPSSLKKSGPGPTAGSSYLDNVGGFAAPVAEQVAPATPAAPASAGSGPQGYLSQMGGGSAMKPSSLKKSGPGPKAGSSYLDNVGGFAAPVAEVAAPATPAAPASAGSGPQGYLSQMGGGSAMKPSSLKKSGPGPTAGSSYLDNVGAFAAPVAEVAAPVVEAAAPMVEPAIPAGSTGYPYLDAIAALGSSAAPAAQSAAPASAAAFSMSELVDDSATAAAAGDYLNSLKVAAAPSGSGPAGYLDILTVSSSTVMGGLGPASYLDNIAGAASVTAKVEAATEDTLTKNYSPVLHAINQLNSNMMQNQKTTIDLLTDISTNMKRIVVKASG